MFYSEVHSEPSQTSKMELFKNGPSEICGRQLLKNLKGYGQLKADHRTCFKNTFSAAIFIDSKMKHNVRLKACSICSIRERGRTSFQFKTCLLFW